MKKLIIVAGVLLVFGMFTQRGGSAEVDLISLVDLNRDVVNGTWQWSAENELIFDSTPSARLAFPYHPPLEYDYAVSFTLTNGSNPWGNFAQLVSHGDVPFTWSTNAGSGHYCRLEDISGHSVIGNPTLTPYTFLAGVEYTSVVRVRNDRVVCEINGQTLVDYPTDYSELSRHPQWTLPDQLNLGVGGWNGPTTIHSATLSEIPEPSSLTLLSMGTLGFLLYGWRRRTAV